MSEGSSLLQPSAFGDKTPARFQLATTRSLGQSVEVSLLTEEYTKEST